jgi:TPR repeat protein
MKLQLALVLTLSATLAMGQADDVASQQSKQPSSTDQELEKLKIDADKLTSYDIFKQLEATEAVQASMNTFSDSWFAYTPKLMAFGAILDKRRKNGQPDGAFYFAAHQWKYCVRLQMQTKSVLVEQASQCWIETIEAFKVASTAGIGDASFNIARQFENGYGVLLSKFAAADWYIKAAEQYNKTNDRDQALTAVEAALGIVPDHPAALRMKRVMLR